MNRETLKAYMLKYRKEHPEQFKKYRANRADKQKIYYENWYKNNGRSRADNYIEKILEWQTKYPNRCKIHGQLNKAIKRCEFVRPTICPQCGHKAKIQAHHINYRSYKNFIWLCASCHKKHHQERGRKPFRFVKGDMA